MVTENGKTALFAGCAHCGIVNILKSAEDVLGRAPDAVFAGFHLYNPSLGKSERTSWIDSRGQKSCAATRSRTTSRATARQGSLGKIET